MKAEDAQNIPLRDVLDKMGLAPIQCEDDVLIYHWPEGNPNQDAQSLLVNLRDNIWFSSLEGTSGGVLLLVCWYLKLNGHSHTHSDALRWLQNMFAPDAIIASILDPDEVPAIKKQYTVKEKTPIVHPALIRHLEQNKIDPLLASQVLRQLRIRNNQSRKIFTAAGVENEDGGFAFFNPVLTGHVYPLTVSFVRGTIAKPEGIHIFYSLLDYLATITYYNQPFENDVLILHAYSCMKDATAYIRNYGYRYACTWLPNTDLGKQAILAFDKFFRTEENLKHRPMNGLYASFPHVSDWHKASNSQAS